MATPTPKPIKKQLQILAGLAYKRELEAELGKLYENFAEWKSGKIDPWELSEKIHKFHNGASRDLYNYYNDQRFPEDIVAFAIRSEVFTRDEIPAEVWPYVEPILNRFQPE